MSPLTCVTPNPGRATPNRCGVTPQTAVMQAKLPLAITHAPGHMSRACPPSHEPSMCLHVCLCRRRLQRVRSF